MRLTPYDFRPTLAQQKALAICPKITAGLSVLGSAFIIQEILRDQAKRTKIYYRLVLGMSSVDFVCSVAWFCTTWPVIKGTPYAWCASGNQFTCSLQGFFTAFSVSTVMYNAALCCYYLLFVSQGWKKARIARVEPFLHTIALSIGLGTSFAGLSLKLYNFADWDCWIAPYPPGCKESFMNNGETTCIRGDNANLYRWVFHYGLIWIAIVFITFMMFNVYTSVRTKEVIMKRLGLRYAGGAMEGPNKERGMQARTIAKQGMFYVGAMYLTYLFPTILLIVFLVANLTYYFLFLGTAIMLPIQGFFNMLVYRSVSAQHCSALV